jgi:hypothetical protein
MIDDKVHYIEIGAGNVTYCEKRFTMFEGEWTKKFTVYRDDVTCEKCKDKLLKIKL